MQEELSARSEFHGALEGEGEELNRQTVLLVEDEEMVRKLMTEVLELEGYEVLGCADPREAIVTCLQHGGRIDVLLTDVVMPGMNGRDMAVKILEARPKLRVVFMSGYTEHVLMRDGKLDATIHYLQKPFSLETLVWKLNEVLSEGTVQ